MTQLVMSEEDLKTTVIDMCRTLGLLVAHFRPAQTAKGWRTPIEADGAGFPDLVIVGPGGVLFWETKSAKGKASKDQKCWLARLNQAGAQARLIKPCDLRDGTIIAALKAIAKPDMPVSGDVFAEDLIVQDVKRPARGRKAA